MILRTFLTLFTLLLLCPGQGPCADFTTVRAQLLKNREYGEALLKGIRDARSRILVSCYLFKITDLPENLPLRIAQELISARQRGVEVTVILERSRDPEDSLNRANAATAALLSRNGIAVRFDSLRKTTHSKIAVIDGRYLFLGSHNLTQNALGSNNELSVLMDSPEMAREVTDYLGGV
jgi:phosphatidylserine/phosphatidylglycerophosphate/cardiolipin synthase-like enzyme